MNINLDYTNVTGISKKIAISGSKSESNRLLILQQFFSEINIVNLSNSEDTEFIQKALSSSSKVIDIGHAGTAMRFLTAYFAIQDGRNTVLTGSKRMQERPIAVLVSALRKLGAEIAYQEKEAYPPLLIRGKKFLKNTVRLQANISSQYISALLLIAPVLPKGLELFLEGEIISNPYIKMTLSLLDELGIKVIFKEKRISVSPISMCTQNMPWLGNNKTITIEPDWSSASYYYSLVALHPSARIELIGFKRNSRQGDSILSEMYKKFGVHTVYKKSGIILLSKPNILSFQDVSLNLSDTPDLAQTLVVTCLGMGIDCHLTGLHTLKIKETDRLQALKNELEKFGAKVKITDDSLKLTVGKKLLKDCKVATYQDHRMAMAFAPLSVKVPLQIENMEVVSKSYPDFWKDFNAIFRI